MCSSDLYSASFELKADGWATTNPLRLVSGQAVEKLIAEGEQIVTPDETSTFPGAVLLRPSSAELGRLAARRIDFVPGEKLEPIYLRETTFAKAPPPKFY